MAQRENPHREYHMLDHCKAVAKRAGLDEAQFNLKTFRSPFCTGLCADFRAGRCQGSRQAANSTAPQKPANQRRYVLRLQLELKRLLAEVHRDQQSKRVTFAKTRPISASANTRGI